MRRLILTISASLIVMGLGLLWAKPAAADSLSIAPLEYTATLKQGSTEKGHVDIVNPSAQQVHIQLHVSAFRQINNQGGLQFYDDSTITNGVKLDLTDVELGPHEGVRVYFLLDSSKLPSGDVFAAIFATTVSPNKLIESIPAAQVGSLLLLENGTPPAHHAAIQHFQANWLQIGSAITMQMTIANTDATNGAAIGFTPQLQLKVQPYTSKTVQGPLVFSGRSRVVDYRQEGNYFGPLLLNASTGQSQQTTLIFAITGFWQWLAPLLALLLAAAFYTLWITRKKRFQKQR